MTDSSGAVVWSADYKPFGEATVTVSTITNNLRFPGQYYDSETANHYNYRRDYNPVLGRYIETDPIGIQGGDNHLFVYTENNPVNYVDPEGLGALKIIKLCAKGYKVVKSVGFREAVKAVRRGENILAESGKEAKKLARAASQGKRPIRNAAHQEGYMKHFHPDPRTGSHVFYSVAAALTLSHYVQCDDCTEAKLASVVDFFNPLATPQDIIDIYDEVTE